MTLRCPICEVPAGINLSLADGKTMVCIGCDEEFCADDARDALVRWNAQIANWEVLLAWIDKYPFIETSK